MKKFKENWSNTKPFDKFAFIFSIILSISVMCLAILGLLRILQINLTNLIALPTLGLMFLINAIKLKSQKGLAIFYFIAAAVIFFFSITIILF